MDIEQFRKCELPCVEETATRKSIIPFEREILMLSGVVVKSDYKKDASTVKAQNTQAWQHAPSNSKTSRRRPRKWGLSKQCTADQD